MSRSVSGLGGVAVLVVLLTAGPVARASEPELTATGGSRTTLLEHLTDTGAAIRVGLGVSPLRWPPGPVAVPAADPGESATAVSFDLNLTWPGAGGASPLEPYLVLGPALFVVEPTHAERLLGTRVDPALQLGARAGAGVNWRLGKRLTLFGAYEITTPSPDGLVPAGVRPPAGHGIGQYDFSYGLRLRY